MQAYLNEHLLVSETKDAYTTKSDNCEQNEMHSHGTL
jgi:hypothetical protein